MDDRGDVSQSLQLEALMWPVCTETVKESVESQRNNAFCFCWIESGSLISLRETSLVSPLQRCTQNQINCTVKVSVAKTVKRGCKKDAEEQKKNGT